jgi:gliding motility-associated-like protein
LDITVSNLQCDDNRTGLDPSDDLFTFDLTVNGSNVSASWRADNPAMTTANYGATRSFGPYPISGGNANLVIQDVADRFCRENVSVSPPATCSDSCLLEVINYAEGPCDDNNTGPDKTDDFFFIDLLVDGQNASVTQTYTVTIGFTVLGPYTYGVNEQVGPIPANGNWQILLIEDATYGYCQGELRLRKDPCSDCDGETADAGADKIITCSQNEVQLSGSASAQGNYSWVGPSSQQYNGPNPNVGDPGMYILTVTFAKGCTDTDTVIVTRDTNLPIADPGSDKNLTCIVDTVTIGGSRTSTGSNLVYIWRDINNNIISSLQYTQITIPGTYCLEVIDTVLDCASAVNCVVVGEMRDEPSGDILVNPEDAFDCRIDSIQLTAGNTDGSTHHWEKRTVVYFSDTLWVTDTGMVHLVITDTLTGCTKILDIEINSLVDYPFINIKRPDTITCRRETVTIDGQASQFGPTIIYEWFDKNGNKIPGADQRTLMVSEPGTYYFHVFDNFNGCENFDTIVVPESRIYPIADAGGDKIIKCDSVTTVLTATNSTVRNGIQYEWSGLGSGSVIAGGDTRFPQVDGGGNFVLTVRDNVTGCLSRDTVFVNKVYAPSIDHLVVKGERCGGDDLGSINILGISGIRPFTYQMNGRDVDTLSFDSLRPGLFFFRITDSLGCKTDTLLEILEGNYLNFEIKGDTFITKGDSTVLRVEIDLPPNEIDQMYWSEDGSVFCFRCYEIVVKPDTTTIYNFRLIDINGCEIELDFEVKVQQRNDIFVPNIFTPNEDTENEILHVFGKHLVRINRMMIFNRWGELVFRGDNLPPGPIWDGKWNGDYHVPAVLTYLIEAEFDDGEHKQFTGDITLLR